MPCGSTSLKEHKVEFKDHLAILREQYKQECDDNNEIFRRAGLVYLLIVAVGTMSFNVVRLTKVPFTSANDLRVWASATVFAVLFYSAVLLGWALVFGKWDHPDLDELDSRDSSKPIRFTSDEKLVREYAKAVQENRERNLKRYGRLGWSLGLTLLAGALILVQVGVNVWKARNVPHVRQNGAASTEEASQE